MTFVICRNVKRTKFPHLEKNILNGPHRLNRSESIVRI